MNKFYIVFALLLLILLSGCEGSDPVAKYEISGTITLQDELGNNVNDETTGIVRLFKAVDTEYEFEFRGRRLDYVGPNIHHGLFHDYSKDENWLIEYETASSYSLKDILPGEYILYYEYENYGWGYQFIQLSLDTTHNIIMRRSVSPIGLLNGDITWGPNQHIKLDGDVYIEVGSELVIEENTIIEINEAKLHIYGNLTVNGNTNSPVLFTHSSNTDNWSRIVLDVSSISVIDYAILYKCQTGFEIKSSQNSISNTAIIDCYGIGVSYDHCDGVFNHCAIINASQGIIAAGTNTELCSPIITYSMFVGCIDRSIHITDSSLAIVTDNIISDCEWGLEYAKTHGTVVSSEVEITNNLVQNCSQHGLYINRTIPSVEYNTIRDCRIGISIANTDISLRYNNFSNFILYAVKLVFRGGGSTITADRNWWSTTNTLEIADLIYDESDESGGYDLGYVYATSPLSSDVDTAIPREEE